MANLCRVFQPRGLKGWRSAAERVVGFGRDRGGGKWEAYEVWPALEPKSWRTKLHNGKVNRKPNWVALETENWTLSRTEPSDNAFLIPVFGEQLGVKGVWHTTPKMLAFCCFSYFFVAFSELTAHQTKLGTSPWEAVIKCRASCFRYVTLPCTCHLVVSALAHNGFRRTHTMVTRQHDTDARIPGYRGMPGKFASCLYLTQSAYYFAHKQLLLQQ